MRTVNDSVLDGRDVARLVRACARAHGLAPAALRGLTLRLRHDDRLASLVDASVGPSNAEIVVALPGRWVEPGVVEQLAQLAAEDEVPTRVVRALCLAIEFVVRHAARESVRPAPCPAPHPCWSEGFVVRRRRRSLTDHAHAAESRPTPPHRLRAK